VKDMVVETKARHFGFNFIKGTTFSHGWTTGIGLMTATTPWKIMYTIKWT
jgi:hypothetical protein